MELLLYLPITCNSMTRLGTAYCATIHDFMAQFLCLYSRNSETSGKRWLSRTLLETVCKRKGEFCDFIQELGKSVIEVVDEFTILFPFICSPGKAEIWIGQKERLWVVL